MSTFTILSCNKNNESEDLKTIDLTKKSDIAKVNLVSTDKDWQIIASKNLEVITTLVESKVDINQLDFNNEESFLNVIGMNKTEYLENAGKSKAASDRLIKRYNLQQNSISAECVSCKTTAVETESKLKKMILSFRQNKASFAKFKSLLSNPPTTNSVAPGESGDWCCRWPFYACAAVCSASFPIFIAYLACCALCYAEYCCS